MRAGSCRTSTFTWAQIEEDVQHLLRGVPAARADVVDLSRLPALEGQPVRPHHVAHVREVADRLEIAHVDDGLAEPFSISATWRGEVGRDEDLAAPGAGVVEPAGPDHVELVAPPVLVGEEVLGHLGDGIRRERAERAVLADRHLVRQDQPVLLARPRRCARGRAGRGSRIASKRFT